MSLKFISTVLCICHLRVYICTYIYTFPGFTASLMFSWFSSWLLQASEHLVVRSITTITIVTVTTSVTMIVTTTRYDQMLYEDITENRMDESLSLFNKIISYNWFRWIQETKYKTKLFLSILGETRHPKTKSQKYVLLKVVVMKWNIFK